MPQSPSVEARGMQCSTKDRTLFRLAFNACTSPKIIDIAFHFAVRHLKRRQACATPIHS